MSEKDFFLMVAGSFILYGLVIAVLCLGYMLTNARLNKIEGMLKEDPEPAEGGLAIQPRLCPHCGKDRRACS